MGFYREISDTYGQPACRLLKLWASDNRKLASLINQRIFLLKCRQFKVFPAHIEAMFNFKHRTMEQQMYNSVVNSANRFKRDYLNSEIKNSIKNLNYTKNRIHQTKLNSYQHLPASIINEFSNKQKSAFQHMVEKIRNKQIAKLNRIKQQKDNLPKFNPDWLINLTDIDIPLDIKTLLSLGPKFALPDNDNRIPTEKIITEVEHVLHNLPEDKNPEIVRSECINIITNHINKNKSNKNKKHQNNQLATVSKATKHFLSDNNDILVLQADKSNKTVIMYKTEYFNRMNSSVCLLYTSRCV